MLDKIRQAVEGYKSDPQWEEIGKVIEVGDGIIKISGLLNVKSQEILLVETDTETIRAVA